MDDTSEEAASASNGLCRPVVVAGAAQASTKGRDKRPPLSAAAPVVHARGTLWAARHRAAPGHVPMITRPVGLCLESSAANARGPTFCSSVYFVYSSVNVEDSDVPRGLLIMLAATRRSQVRSETTHAQAQPVCSQHTLHTTQKNKSEFQFFPRTFLMLKSTCSGCF